VLIYIVAGLTTGSIFALARSVWFSPTKLQEFSTLLTVRCSVSPRSCSTFSTSTWHGVAIAAAICVLIGGPVAGFFLEVVARRLATVTLATKVLGTVGFCWPFRGHGIALCPGPYREVPQFLPVSYFVVDGTRVEYFRVIIFAIGLFAVVGLTLFLRWSKLVWR